MSSPDKISMDNTIRFDKNMCKSMYKTEDLDFNMSPEDLYKENGSKHRAEL